MLHNPIYSKPFLKSLFLVQNNWHKHGVLIHTIKVAYHAFKAKRYDMIPAAFLHDIGKPRVAYQKEEDIEVGEYSFTDHEEKSYQMIKDIPFISNYTKQLVRYHYLIRDIKKSKTEDPNRYKQKVKIWDTLSDEFKEDLHIFLVFDDKAKR
jgi:predicted HD phosphohydrolase